MSTTATPRKPGYLAVYDTLDDTTRPVLEAYAERDSRLKPVLNTNGKGPAQAIRFGISRAHARRMSCGTSTASSHV